MENRWKIAAAAYSGKGKVRGNNEDNLYFDGQYVALSDMNNETVLCRAFEKGCALFAVCDGMGGHENGEIASYTAVCDVHNLADLLAEKEFGKAIGEWTTAVNQHVHLEAQDGGCTIVLLWFRAGRIHIAHAGDSRVYRFHDNVLDPMTRDHSKVQMLQDAGLITAEEARVHPQRHMITRYLGMDDEDTTVQLAVSRTMPLFPCDRYLLCSDGVTDMLDDRQLEELMQKYPDTQKCAEAIYQAALQKGGRDNTTLILLDFEENKSAASPEDSAVNDPVNLDEDVLEATEIPDASPSSDAGAVHFEQFLTANDQNACFRIVSEIKGFPLSLLRQKGLSFESRTQVIRRHP